MNGASFVLGDCLYVMGGYGQASSAERYNVTSNTWTAVAGMLEGRFSPCAVTTVESAGPADGEDLFDALIVKAEL
jgi:hypothetical protein